MNTGSSISVPGRSHPLHQRRCPRRRTCPDKPRPSSRPQHPQHPQPLPRHVPLPLRLWPRNGTPLYRTRTVGLHVFGTLHGRAQNGYGGVTRAVDRTTARTGARTLWRCGDEAEREEAIEGAERRFVEGAKRLVGKVKMGGMALIPGGRLREWRVGMMAVLKRAA